MKHQLRMTGGLMIQRYPVIRHEPPWRCEVCRKYFHRRTDAETCKGQPVEHSPVKEKPHV